MNKEHYYRLLENPQLLSKDSLKDLEDLISSYPYVENFRILYALNLLVLDDFRYQKNLHKAAFHASDRKKLKYWIDSIFQKEEAESVEDQMEAIIKKQSTSVPVKEESYSTLVKPEENEESDPEQELETEEIPAEEVLKERSIPYNQAPLREEKIEIEAQEEELKESEQNPVDFSEEKKEHQKNKSKADLLRLVRKRLAEIESEKRAEQEEKSENEDTILPKNLKAQLIDRFIEVQPSISRPEKNDFHNPHKDAVDSTIDEDDFFVTETLAQIHKQQGNINKAKEIYQKLILKNPEKSTYFAAQIQELSKHN